MKSFADCTFCGGQVTERLVQKVCWWGEKLSAVVDNVPTGVCEQCGEKYYKAEVLKAIESLLKEKQSFDQQISIPFTDYQKALSL